MHEMTSDAVTNARKHMHVRIANDSQESSDWPKWYCVVRIYNVISGGPTNWLLICQYHRIMCISGKAAPCCHSSWRHCLMSTPSSPTCYSRCFTFNIYLVLDLLLVFLIVKQILNFICSCMSIIPRHSREVIRSSKASLIAF